jgi:hypothetical protein
MTIRVMRKGDHVINVTSEFVAIERKNGEVDIIPLHKDGETFRLDAENVVTIGFGDNVVQTQAGDVTITTF